jgi:hypothetical protein
MIMPGTTPRNVPLKLFLGAGEKLQMFVMTHFFSLRSLTIFQGH